MSQPVWPSPDLLTAAKSLAVDRAAAAVIETLTRAGVRSILLKGASLAIWLYEGDPPRSYLDCDLLVAPENIARAEETLTRMGFEHPPRDDLPYDKPWHAHAWVRRGTPTVDLHRTLIGVGVPPNTVWEVLSARTELMRIGGLEVEVLDAAARTVHVALHTAQHGAGIRRPMRDLERAVKKMPFETWQEAALLAGRLGASLAFSAGLRIDPEGAKIADRLNLPEDKSVELILRSMTATHIAVGIDWLVRTQGLSGKLKLIFHKLVPPPNFIRAWTPIAQEGTLGLAIGYVWRPIWLIWHLGPALRVWLRARRRAAP
jgi:hypothetical protein